MLVRLPGKQKVRGSSPAKEYQFLRSVGIPSRCLVLFMSHSIRHSHHSQSKMKEIGCAKYGIFGMCFWLLGNRHKSVLFFMNRLLEVYYVL